MPAYNYIHAYGEPPYIDLKNVPRDKVTVTVTVDDSDGRLKKIIEARIKNFKSAQDKAILGKMWVLVGRLDTKISILEDVLKDYNRA